MTAVESPVSLGFNEALITYGFKVPSQHSESPGGRSKALLPSDS